jgi:hypothetical protein
MKPMLAREFVDWLLSELVAWLKGVIDVLRKVF